MDQARIAGLTAALAAAVALAVAGVAGAHGGGSDASIANTVTALAPPLPGVGFEIAQSIVPELVATNTSSHELEVLGPDGRPYLRLGPRGTEGNLSSPALYRSSDPSNSAPIPPAARRRNAPPRWVRLSRRPEWGWFDARIRPDIDQAPPAVRARHRPTRLATWTIPVRYGGRPAQVRGRVDYRPPVGAPVAALSSPTQVAPGVVAGLTAGTFPDLFVSNSGRSTLTVLGRDGEPFAQIGPRGVRVNLRSPIHVADALARGQAPAVVPNAAAHPLWRRVSTAPSYDWLESRARYGGPDPPRAVLVSASPTTLERWAVPLLIGGRRVLLRGRIDWRPAPDARATLAAAPHRGAGGGGNSPAVWLVLGAAALAALAAAAIFARRRSPR